MTCRKESTKQFTCSRLERKSIKEHSWSKKIFDKGTKSNDFQVRNIVLKWDSRREEKGKHGKFENLWKGPYIIHSIRGHNAFFLEELNGEEVFLGPVNGRMLKHYFFQGS